MRGIELFVESRKFQVVLEPQPEGGYVAYVPELPGCLSQGETEDEVLKNIREAIELYLEVKDSRH
ncbi:type II toxin-antitoxin system HicB family antitoxin [Pyrococcus kukulkanii]|uniref:type II toxin-antitoxin system HicB family antitoxin n=1 Tax=Pyrococcus kukulkanii TaxID=1609559 RepID=UPI000F133603|nr:MAG: type II toxin-antitoxin system HicB family antitoxin [Thermococci archaeon]